SRPHPKMPAPICGLRLRLARREARSRPVKGRFRLAPPASSATGPASPSPPSPERRRRRPHSVPLPADSVLPDSPCCASGGASRSPFATGIAAFPGQVWPTGLAKRSEEHTSELQSRGHLVCRLLLEKKNCISLLLTTLHQVSDC